MHLRKWKNDLRKSLDINNDFELEDNDHPDCPRCGSTMEFHGHDDSGDYPLGDGYWKCPGCGYSITEDEIWDSM